MAIWIHRHLAQLRAIMLCAVVGIWCSCGSSAPDGAEADETGDAQADSTARDSTGDSTAVDSTVADSAAKLERDSVPVETAAAVHGDISSYLVFSSTVETEAAVEIHPEVSGQVEAVLVEEGDHVTAGDLLVSLVNDQASLEDRESAVNLRHLEASFERTEEMNSRKLISAQAYEDKLFQLEQAKLRHEKARLALAHTQIRAPFSGVLTSRQVQVGARVAPGTKLFDLVKLDDMIARVHVPGRHLRTVQPGQIAEVQSDFIPDMVFPGYVKRISPVVDPKSGTFRVTMGLRDNWENLRPGIFVKVRIVIDTHTAAVLIPKEAVIYDGADRYVFVVADSLARRIRLDAGYENSQFIEARSDVTVDTPVIIVGQNGLKDQARVKVVNAAKAEVAATGTSG